MIKKLFKDMAVAQVISAMTVILCLLIDSIMIGHFLGVDSIASYGLANPLLLSFAAIGSMVSAGVQVVGSKAMGKGNKKESNAYYTTTVCLAFAISAIGLILVFVFMRPLCSLLGAGTSGRMYELTSDYLVGFIIGAPAFLFSTILVPYMQLAGKQTRLVVAVIVMTVVDVILDLVNVFVLHYGMLGMGLASTISYYIAFFIGISYFLGKDCIFKFKLKLYSLRRVAELLKSGVPTVINMLSTVFLTYTLNQILLSITDTVEAGNNAIGAYSIVATVGNVCYCFATGIAGVILMLAGVFYTEEDRLSLFELIRIMVKNSIIIDSIVTVAAFIFAPFVVKLFLGNAAPAEQMATLGIRLFALMIVIDCINTGFKHFYQGVNNIKMTLLMSSLQNFVCPALIAYILSHFIGITGVWCGYLFGAIAVFTILSIISWVRSKKISFSAETYAMLPDDFGVPDENCLVMTASKEEEVVEAASKAANYCKEHGEGKKTAYYVSLCIEEMCANAIKYGFNDGKAHTLDIRLFCKENEWVIRLRDDCKAFDPIKYMKENDESVEAVESKQFGLHMVFSITKKIYYTNSLSLNNLALVLESE